ERASVCPYGSLPLCENHRQGTPGCGVWDGRRGYCVENNGAGRDQEGRVPSQHFGLIGREGISDVGDAAGSIPSVGAGRVVATWRGGRSSPTGDGKPAFGRRPGQE